MYGTTGINACGLAMRTKQERLVDEVAIKNDDSDYIRSYYCFDWDICFL